MVGRQSVWSVHTLPFTPWFWTPGPTMPTQVEAISSWMSPWFQAKLWLVLAGIVAHASGVPQVAGVLEAKKNQSGSANSVNVGVRIGSAVTMWSVFSVTGSASRWVMSVWTWLVYGFSQLSPALSRSSLRTAESVRPGLPVTYTVGASSEWTAKAVVSLNCVRIIALRLALISPTRL